MATDQANTPIANTFTQAIEGNRSWNGVISYNIVQTANNAELNAYNAILNSFPPGQIPPPMTQDFTQPFVDDFVAAMAVLNEFFNVQMVFNNDLNADYLVGEDASTSLGFATEPNPGQQVLAISINDAAHQANAELGGSNDRYLTIIHEFGHSLGLHHPHDNGGGTLVPSADQFNMPVPYTQLYTMMSYTLPNFTPNTAGATAYGRAITPMAFDIAALQNMYGANMTTRATATTYTLTDAMLAPLDLDGTDGTISIGRAYYGIWDAGGVDSITYGGNANALIQLTSATLTNAPGADVTNLINEIMASNAWGTLSAATQVEISNPNATAGGFVSSVLEANGDRIAGGYTIANNVAIENATGGNGNDLIAGNAVANLLLGGGGADSIFGGGGDDTLGGQDGNDVLGGGDGNDVLVGAGGADALSGGGGFDTAFYGDSAAAITVNLGGGTGTGGEAQGDTFATVENVRGSAFNDVITGDALANALIGQGGNDVLEGMAAGDALLGGAGIDTASYTASNGTVSVNIGNGTGAGAHAAGDILVGIENLTGSSFGDLLRGGTGGGDNVLTGLGGGDLMLGDEGSDTLFGGAGGDVMTGGAGNDSFLFDNLSAEQDIITDFDQNGDDILTFTGFGPGFDFGDFQLFTVNVDDVFVIANGWQGGVVLQDAVGMVDATDFVFV